eukprot:PITA_24700
MLGYDFEIIYKKRKQNVVADAFSRNDEDMEALLCAISIIQPYWINEARDEWKNDREVWTLIQKIQQDPKCLGFQQDKVETIKTLGLLQPLSIPSQHWEEVSMDFITGLPKSEGKSVIMVVVDKLPKYAHFCALPFKSSTIAIAFMKTIQKLHGNAKIIVSDKDPIFTGNF